MTIKTLTQKMEWLHNEAQDMESYNELWEAVKTLSNLGLIDNKLREAMVKKDHELFEKANR